DPSVRRSQRARDLDHLALRHAEAADRRARIDRGGIESEVGHQPRRAIVEPAPVDQAETVRWQLAEEDVLGDREVRDEVELLVDDADAEREGVTRAVDRDRTT